MLQNALVRILLCEHTMYTVGLSNRTPSKRRCFVSRTAQTEPRGESRWTITRVALLGGALSVGHDQQNIAQNEFDELGAGDDARSDVGRRGLAI